MPKKLGPQLEKLMEQLRSDMASNPPLPGSYSPKRGDLCAAKYSDDEWYRAKIEKINKDNTVNLLYIDYGNVSIIFWLKTSLTFLGKVKSKNTKIMSFFSLFHWRGFFYPDTISDLFFVM